MADHGRQARSERTDHVVWPAGSSSLKTFSTSTPRLPPSTPSPSSIPTHYHGKSRQNTQSNTRDVLTPHWFGKKTVTPAVFRRLMKELNELRTNPPEGIRVVTNEDNMLDVTGIIEGPGGWQFTPGINAWLTISSRPLACAVRRGYTVCRRLLQGQI